MTITLYPHERLAVFIDGSNIHAVGKSLGWHIDYERLNAFLKARTTLVRASYFTALIDNEGGHNPIFSLVNWLKYNGYETVTKMAKHFTDAAGRQRIKGNMDVEISVWVMKAAPNVDHIMLFTGDGDFTSLVKAVQDMGRRVTVVCTTQGQEKGKPINLIADDLRAQADQFVDIEDLREHLEKADGGINGKA